MQHDKTQWIEEQFVRETEKTSTILPHLAKVALIRGVIHEWSRQETIAVFQEILMDLSSPRPLNERQNVSKWITEVVESPLQSNGSSSKTVSQKALSTMAAQAFQTSISGKTVVVNTTTTTNSETFPDGKPTENSENVSERRDIFSSRGSTGWE